ncbi:MAG: sterol desaturase family protein [Hyphomicrobiaceae bacterium]|nr:sterol desaturase family protein [Hyphomicrobiaceae bacterium]
MSFFGLSESVFRFGSFALIFAIMALAETLYPKRERRFSRTVRWTTNFGILLTDYVAVFVFTFIGMVTAVGAAAYAEHMGWGLLNLVEWPAWIEWLIAIVVLDFVIWAQHVATHKVPILWRLHRVHHSDEDIDASTAIRFHPIEILFSVLVKSAAVLLLGPAAGAVVVFEAFVNGSALFNHANVRLPRWADTILRSVFVTPDMHRVHHSAINRETDSNYGFGLSIWDRLFRTYISQPQKGHTGMTIGLEEWQGDGPSTYPWAISFPFRDPPHTKAGDQPQ